MTTLAALVSPEREGSAATVQGTVTAVSRHSAPSGREWAVITVTDGTAAADVLLFCPAWAAAGDITPGAVLSASGKVIVRDGRPFLFGKAVA